MQFSAGKPKKPFLVLHLHLAFRNIFMCLLVAVCWQSQREQCINAAHCLSHVIKLFGGSQIISGNFMCSGELKLEQQLS